ncbi:MAG: hypothetical protein IRZ15_00450 [Bryobacteraceae bacterium]|nr:hypothetical protein [Bryobacteraceae bacterium]
MGRAEIVVQDVSACQTLLGKMGNLEDRIAFYQKTHRQGAGLDPARRTQR